MLFFVFLLLFRSAGVCDALRVKDNIRIPLTSVHNNCMRLLNGTHQIGCQSDRFGNTGVVTVVRTADDIPRHLQMLPWGLSRLIALVNVKNLDNKLLTELRDNSNVVGVLLYRNQTERFDGFSEDSACPNRAQSFYSPQTQCTWNQQAALFPDGSFFAEYDKPVFVVKNQTEISLLMDACYRSFNRPITDSSNDYRCVARMQAFMLAAGDARLCRDRQVHGSLTSQGQGLCDELLDYNVITMLPAVDANTQQADILALATRLDSFSMFAGSNGGDTSVLVSLIASLSVARSIGLKRTEFESKSQETRRQLMFAHFHVESFGYTGSLRFVYDMQNPQTEKPKYKPDKTAKHLELNDLNVFVELQQLSANHSTFYLHADGNVAKKFDSTMRDLRQSAETGAGPHTSIKPMYTQANARLPPASYQSVLKAREIPGFVIAPFAEEYETLTLNSFFDTLLSELKPEQAKERILSDVTAAGSIAMRVALDYVGNNNREFSEKFTFDKEFASQLIDCFIFDPTWNCSLFASLFTNRTEHITPHMTYIEYGGHSSVRKLTHALMVFALGNADAASNIKQQSECLSKNKNQDLYNYSWQYDPRSGQFHCYQTATYLKLARSPAFELEDYDLRNTTYASWVESRWDKIELELFLDAGYKFELHAFGLALIVVVASGVLFYFLDESMFVNPTDVLPADV